MHTSVRILTVAALAAALLVVGGFGLLFRDAPLPATDVPVAVRTLPVAPAGDSGELVVALQRRVRRLPQDWRSFAALGLAYVQQARVSGDPRYYPKAEGTLEWSLALESDENFEALLGMGALALARHEFADALLWGRRARDVNRHNADVYGVIGDAQLELGRYPAAFEAFQTMVDTRPDISSYARVSYARELTGDVTGAIEAMRRAAMAAGTPQDAAWANDQIGDLVFQRRGPAAARRYYRTAIRLAREFVPARTGLARVAWSRGAREIAISRMEWVVERLPLPEHLAILGDLYASTGRRIEADRAYDLVRVHAALLRANGVRSDVEIALFEADHGNAKRALASAREVWRQRRSVHAADALGWALYANGRYRQAVGYARRALALGSANALFLYHRAMIELRLGDRSSAQAFLERALDLDPNFSILHADRARRTLARLEAS